MVLLPFFHWKQVTKNGPRTSKDELGFVIEDKKHNSYIFCLRDHTDGINVSRFQLMARQRLVGDGI